MTKYERILMGEKLLVCSVCEKNFVNRQTSLYHRVVHMGGHCFLCVMNGNKVNYPANLSRHVIAKHNYSLESNKENECKY